MTLKVQRGADAMDSSRPKKIGSSIFCPEIKWTKDKESKYVGLINSLNYIPSIQLHEFIPTGEAISKAGKPYIKFERFIDRRDPCIGEKEDELTDRLGQEAKRRTMAAAVELEPIVEKINGRDRPVAFSVKTMTYTRMLDEGDEEVTVPVLGIITQSKINFFGWFASFEETNSTPIEEVPYQITRRGEDQNTSYDIVPFMGLPIDYTNLLEYAPNILYFRGEEWELSGSDQEKALGLGELFLDKRIEELADKERYDALVGPIEFIEDRWGPKPARKEPSFDSMIPPVVEKSDSKLSAVRERYSKTTA